MIPSEIEDSLIRYLNGIPDSADLDLLEIWVCNPENDKVFKEFIKTQYAITICMNNLDPNEIKNNVLSEIKRDKKIFRIGKFKQVLKYAAIAILMIGVSYFFLNDSYEIAGEELIVQHDDDIILELNDGEIIVLQDNNSSEITNHSGEVVGHQLGKKLIYKDVFASKLPIYNTLKVPYGKRFDLVLSDGTKVFMNSGSTITYPTRFEKGKDRQVSLTGEAFFEVAHNKQDSFVVDAQEIEVQVFGTKFNLSNYPEDLSTEVVLTEGSVGLSYSSQEVVNPDIVFLKPGFNGSFDRTEKTISTQKVNTILYTSWVEGNMVFRKAPFNHIVKKLERHYNVVITNDNEELGKETFDITIETEREDINQVLEYFRMAYDIEYQNINNKILIN